MTSANSAHWTQAINRVDAHVVECKAEGGGCTRRKPEGYPDCARARRLMRSEDRIRNAYRKAGGRMPPE